jgi:hypothetical protein
MWTLHPEFNLNSTIYHLSSTFDSLQYVQYKSYITSVNWSCTWEMAMALKMALDISTPFPALVAVPLAAVSETAAICYATTMMLAWN